MIRNCATPSKINKRFMKEDKINYKKKQQINAPKEMKIKGRVEVVMLDN